MKSRKLTVAAILLGSTLSIGGIATAYAEHGDGDFYEHGDFEEHDFDNAPRSYENDREPPAYYENTQSTLTSSWDTWLKELSTSKGELPFTETQNVTLQEEGNNHSIQLKAIPKDGEIFIPAQAVSDYLGATATYYETSQILDITKDNTELTFRARTNVVYENQIKTPSPAESFYLDNTFYVPISVITNGLGFNVEWQDQNNTMLITAQ